MRRIINKFIIIACTFLSVTYQISAQEHEDKETYFEAAVNAYNNKEYTLAYEQIMKYEQNTEWYTSLGYWKVVIIDKLIKYNNVSDPKFVDLSKNVQHLLTEAEQTEEKSRNLYDEHYKEIIAIEEKINFVVLKLKWNNDAQYQKALQSFLKQDYAVAKLSADAAAKTNNGAALLLIGQIYEIGNPSQPQNFKTAMNYYEQAYLAGSYDAAYHIGYLYFHGLGVVKNIDLAFDWCSIAANYSYIPAMKELSNMYKHGLGTPKNPELQQYWWQKATAQP